MAELNYEVDLNDANEGNFDPVPVGEYLVVIEDSDFVETKTGGGMYLKLKYKIIDGEFKNRTLYENLNLVNKNKQAEAIARRALNAIGAAVDVHQIDDSAQLHGRPLIISVGMRDNGEYGMQNVIKKHISAASEPQKAVTKEENTEKSQQATPAPSNGGSEKDPPWIKKKGGLKK